MGKVSGDLLEKFFFSKLALNAGHLGLFHFADRGNALFVKGHKAGAEVCSARVDYDYAFSGGLFFRRQRPSANHVLVGLLSMQALVHVV